MKINELDINFNSDLEQLIHLMFTPERLQKFYSVAHNRVKGLTSLYDRVHDPHNIAACIRSAESFGIMEVHCILPQSFRSHSKVSATSDRWVDVHTYSEMHKITDPLKKEGYQFYAALPHRDAIAFDLIHPPEKTVLVFGAEKWGISPELESLCDQKITIPMVGFTESLNISTAHAILVQYFASAFRKEKRTLSKLEQGTLIKKWIDREIHEKTRGTLLLKKD